MDGDHWCSTSMICPVEVNKLVRNKYYDVMVLVYFHPTGIVFQTCCLFVTIGRFHVYEKIKFMPNVYGGTPFFPVNLAVGV